MDLITDLPTTSLGFDSLWICVDCLKWSISRPSIRQMSVSCILASDEWHESMAALHKGFVTHLLTVDPCMRFRAPCLPVWGLVFFTPSMYIRVLKIHTEISRSHCC
jgi:hypothetical protein